MPFNRLGSLDMKYYIGDQVVITKNLAKWRVSKEGQDFCFPSSGILSPDQDRSHNLATILALATLMDEPPVGTILSINWPGDPDMNYHVQFNLLGEYYYTNLLTSDMRKVKETVNERS